MDNKKQVRIKYAYAMTTPIVLCLGGGLVGWFLAKELFPGSNLAKALMLFSGVVIGFTIAVIDILCNPFLNPPPNNDEEIENEVQQYIKQEIEKIEGAENE